MRSDYLLDRPTADAGSIEETYLNNIILYLYQQKWHASV